MFIAQKKIAVLWIFIMPRITGQSFPVQTTRWRSDCLKWNGNQWEEDDVPDGERNSTKEDVIYILSKWAPFWFLHSPQHDNKVFPNAYTMKPFMCFASSYDKWVHIYVLRLSLFDRAQQSLQIAF